MPVTKRYDKHFFKCWSPEMAYILGFFAADGNMIRTKRGTHFVSFYSADKSILANIQHVLRSEHALSKRVLPTGTNYRFQIGSKEVFNDLLCLGFTPRKTRRMRLPNVPQKLLGHFVRGYFDGDGNVWAGLMNRQRKKPTLSMQVFFTSGCIAFLRDLLHKLRLAGIRGGSVVLSPVGQYGRLRFSTLDALKLYEIMYDMPHRLFLLRKKRVFEKFITMRS